MALSQEPTPVVHLHPRWAATLSAPGITETAWQPTAPGTDESRYYDITVTLDAAAPDSVQDSTADGVEFEWLATNT